MEEGEGEAAHTIVLKGQIPVDVSLDRDQLGFTLPAAEFKNIYRDTTPRPFSQIQRWCHQACNTVD